MGSEDRYQSQELRWAPKIGTIYKSFERLWTLEPIIINKFFDGFCFQNVELNNTFPTASVPKIITNRNYSNNHDRANKNSSGKFSSSHHDYQIFTSWWTQNGLPDAFRPNPLTHALQLPRRSYNSKKILKFDALWTHISNACLDLILGQNEEKSPNLTYKGPKHIQFLDQNHVINIGPQGSIQLPNLWNSTTLANSYMKKMGQNYRSSNLS